MDLAMSKIDYKFNEDKLIQELKDYIDSTYNQHYASSGRIQVTEFIMSQLDQRPDFFQGNVLKYAARYGHKDGYNRKDLMKAMHYLIMLLAYHDKKFADNSKPANPDKFPSHKYVTGCAPQGPTPGSTYTITVGDKDASST